MSFRRRDITADSDGKRDGKERVEKFTALSNVSACLDCCCPHRHR
jgi:hypothetical protein